MPVGMKLFLDIQSGISTVAILREGLGGSSLPQIVAWPPFGSGDSRTIKVGGLCGAKEKVVGKHKCLSCMVIVHCVED